MIKGLRYRIESYSAQEQPGHAHSFAVQISFIDNPKKSPLNVTVLLDDHFNILGFKAQRDGCDLSSLLSAEIKQDAATFITAAHDNLVMNISSQKVPVDKGGLGPLREFATICRYLEQKKPITNTPLPLSLKHFLNLEPESLVVSGHESLSAAGFESMAEEFYGLAMLEGERLSSKAKLLDILCRYFVLYPRLPDYPVEAGYRWRAWRKNPLMPESKGSLVYDFIMSDWQAAAHLGIKGWFNIFQPERNVLNNPSSFTTTVALPRRFDECIVEVEIVSPEQLQQLQDNNLLA